MNDLYLKFVFTDRAGRAVYNIYNESDIDGGSPLYGVKVLGQIRLSPDHDDGDVDWAEEQETD